MKPPLTREEFNALASMATEPGGLTAAQIERVLDSHRALLDRDDPHEPAFYKVGQTGVEPAVPAETTSADRIKALEAEVQRFVGERDAALSRLGTLKNNLSITMRRTTTLEVLAGKVNAIRNSIVGMQGFNFSEHAYPLVAALDEAGFRGVGYEMAAKNLGTLIEQRDAADRARDEARGEATQWAAFKGIAETEAKEAEEALAAERKAHTALREAVGNFFEHKRGHPERGGLDALRAAFTAGVPAKKHKSPVTMLHEDGSVTCDASDCWCRG